MHTIQSFSNIFQSLHEVENFENFHNNITFAQFGKLSHHTVVYTTV